MTLEEMQRDQERDFAAMNAAAEEMEKKIAGLSKDLRPEILRSKTAELRAAAGKALQPLVVAMAARAKAADEQKRMHSPEAELRLARFHDDNALNATMQIATFTRLARTPTAELVEHMADAVAARNLALAEAVRLEFSSRPEPERRDLKEAFSLSSSTTCPRRRRGEQ